ncbi:hypothetical protein [Corynebacterium sp. 335C]
MSDDADDAAGAGRGGRAAHDDAPSGAPRRTRRPWGLIALAAVFALSALTVLFAPVRWLAFPAAMPGIDPNAPEHQRAIVAIVAAQVDDDPVGDFPGVGVGDTGQDPGGDAAAPDEVPADDPAAGPNGADGGDSTGAAGTGNGPGGRVDAEDAAPEEPPVDPDGAERAGEDARRGDADPDESAVFASWVLAEAGLPVRGDGTSSGAPWSTTSVAELESALRDRGAFTSDDDYMPEVGDIVLFDGPGPVGPDARVVVGVFDRDITVAGFRDGEVSVDAMGLRGRSGILGFGRTAELERQRMERDASRAAGAGSARDRAAEEAGAAAGPSRWREPAEGAEGSPAREPEDGPDGSAARDPEEDGDGPAESAAPAPEEGGDGPA